MKIGKHFLAGLLTVALVLPVVAQDKQYDVKLLVYPQDQKAETGAKQKRENPRRDHRMGMDCDQVQGQGQCPDTGKAACCEEAAACPAKGTQCDKAQGCDKPCCKMQGGGMQGCPMGKGAHGMSAMGPQGHGTPFMNSVQYREMRRKQRADFYGDRFYLGTNALALVAGMPNVNAEWRRDERFGVRLSVGGAYWSWVADDESFGGFWINPEVRWYLGECKAWYAGPMAKVGYVSDSYENITSIAVGGTFGYMQRVGKKFAIDYNVGVGFSAIGHSDDYYDSVDGTTTAWHTNFAPLKVGISFVWQTCSKPYKR